MYHLISDIIRQSEENECVFWEIVQQADADERGVSKEESFETMRKMYQAMREADEHYDPKVRSASGMAGGAGQLLHEYNETGGNICGDFVGKVMEKAIKMGESNACMHRIVAAPTAGSCGVIPAVFLVAEEMLHLSEDQMVEAMYVSAGIGSVIAENASLAGPPVDARRRLVLQVPWQQEDLHIYREAMQDRLQMQQPLRLRICLVLPVIL